MQSLPRGVLLAAIAFAILAVPTAAQSARSVHLVTLDVQPVVSSGPYGLSSRATATLGLRSGGVHIWGSVSPVLFGDPAPTVQLPDATEASATQPSEVALRPAFPNPSHGGARVPFELPAAAHVRVTLYDVLGREVAVLADAEHDAGRHEVSLDASRLAAGVYHLRMTSGSFVATQALTVVR